MSGFDEPGTTADMMVRRVRMRARLPEEADAERLLTAVLHALGERLSGEAAGALAEELPTPFDAAVGDAAHGQEFDPAGMFDRVAAAAGIEAHVAAEVTPVVVGAVAEMLDEPRRLALARALPEAFRGMLERPRDQRPAGPAPGASHHTPPGAGDTLSTGRPGSRSPVSSAAPTDAHPGSIAGSDDPHAAHKLSSGRQHGDSLADGRPGSSRPVSDGD